VPDDRSVADMALGVALGAINPGLAARAEKTLGEAARASGC
jgi:hypothetical protein